MGGGLHLASRTPQLAMSPGPARVLASGGSWQVWPLSVVHGRCSARWTDRPAPLILALRRGSPTEVGNTGFPEQGFPWAGVFPLLYIPALH
jgi:hypothetical protein